MSISFSLASLYLVTKEVTVSSRNRSPDYDVFHAVTSMNGTPSHQTLEEHMCPWYKLLQGYGPW